MDEARTLGRNLPDSKVIICTIQTSKEVSDDACAVGNGSGNCSVTRNASAHRADLLRKGAGVVTVTIAEGEQHGSASCTSQKQPVDMTSAECNAV